MANQIFASNYPKGMQMEQRFQHVFGKIQLAASVGNQFGGPESLDWTNILTGAVYATGGTNSNGTALITALSASAGTITATAANRFVVGQSITFVGLTTTIGLLLNGQTVQVVTATSSQFTFVNTATGSGSGETGMAVSGSKFFTYGLTGNNVTATVTSLSATAASGGTPAYITVTAANNFFKGASVTFSGLTTVLGLLMNGVQFTVLWANQTSFAILSALTGSAGSDSGTAIAQNPCAPTSFICSSSAASGIIYQADQRNWNLYPFESAGFTPAGTNSAPTITTTSGGVTTALGVAAGALSEVTGASGITGVQAPVFTGSAVSAAALAKITGAYPSSVTGDLISWSAYFLKDGN
jgi:hypothetical protein